MVNLFALGGAALAAAALVAAASAPVIVSPSIVTGMLVSASPSKASAAPDASTMMYWSSSTKASSARRFGVMISPHTGQRGYLGYFPSG